MSEPNEKPFVSCIKIKGLQLLPPVINEDRRIELLKDKQQAIKLEKRLENCRSLKNSLRELLNFRTLSEQSQSSHSEFDSIKSSQHVDALEMVEPKLNSPNKDFNLSMSIVDVSQYNADGIKVINLGENNREQVTLQGHKSNEITQLYSPTISQPNDSFTDNKHHLHVPFINSDHSSLHSSPRRSSMFEVNTTNSSFPKILSSPVKPRLIRSNSYTLENPSPILLAHLQKFSESMHEDQVQQTKQLRPNSSIEDYYTPLEKSEYSSLNTIYYHDPPNPFTNDKPEHPLEIPIENTADNNTPAQVDLIHADISVQHFTVCNNVAEETEIKKSTFELSDPNSQLLNILKNIPEDYSKRIIDLIERERVEQQKELEEDRLNENCDKSKDQVVNSSTVDDSPDRLTGSVLSASPSIWLPSSLIDLECDSRSITSDYFISTEISPKTPISNHPLDNDNTSCRKKLIYNKDNGSKTPTAMMNIKREQAASVIGAHIKGYLTRRLLKTEKVQSLIGTIRDALMCALQLHQAENIDESDVELHRRLINQVTAACYAFHDIFFTLSTSEQMYLISTDRQRKKEKAKRPVSAPNPQRPASVTKKQRTTALSKSVTKV